MRRLRKWEHPDRAERTKRAHEQRLDWERKRGRICGKARAKRGNIRKSKIGSPKLKRGDGMRHDAGARIETNGGKGINRERGGESLKDHATRIATNLDYAK